VLHDYALYKSTFTLLYLLYQKHHIGRLAILLNCAKFHWNRTVGCRVMAKKRCATWRLSVFL